MKPYPLSTYESSDLDRLDHGVGPIPGKCGGHWHNRITTELLESLKDGNHHAFEVVFHMFYPRVEAFLKLFTKSEDVAEELSQETFINLWVKREQINPDKNFNAYIYRIARNAALNHFCKKNPLSGHLDCDQYDDRESESTLDDIFARETELLVKMIVSKMPPQRRKIFVLSRKEHKTNDEIAEDMGITKKAVEKHLRLALHDIKQAIRILALILLP